MQCACAIFYCSLQLIWRYDIFPHYLINGTIFCKVFGYKMCVLIFSKILSKTFLLLRRNQQDIIVNVHTSSCKVPFWSDFNPTWIFSIHFSEMFNIKFHENLSSGSRVVPRGWTDVQTDMTKLKVASRSFADIFNRVLIANPLPDIRYNKDTLFFRKPKRQAKK